MTNKKELEKAEKARADLSKKRQALEERVAKDTAALEEARKQLADGVMAGGDPEQLIGKIQVDNQALENMHAALSVTKATEDRLSAVVTWLVKDSDLATAEAMLEGANKTLEGATGLAEKMRQLADKVEAEAKSARPYWQKHREPGLSLNGLRAAEGYLFKVADSLRAAADAITVNNKNAPNPFRRELPEHAYGSKQGYAGKLIHNTPPNDPRKQ